MKTKFVRHLTLTVAIVCIVAGLNRPFQARASIYNVTNNNFSGIGSLSQALSQAQSDPNAVINISSGLGTITLSGALPAIQNNLILNGNGNTISGANANRIFFVNAPGNTVQINDLILTNGLVQGGSGGLGYGGGGGGAGLGGAIFLDTGNLTVSNISFANNAAYGGSGSIGTDFGNGGTVGGGGGGGGMAFGGGRGGASSIDNGETFEGPGGGGGALTSGGGAGNPNAGNAGTGGGVNGGIGGLLGLDQSGGNGGSPSLPDGGGGGGGFSTGGGNGGSGGNGSDFSGGGGAGSSDNGNSGGSGNGGFGGGGGGNAFSLGGFASQGGNGGFGGGGGGGGEGVPSGSAVNAPGGAGGFGGGAGANGATGNGGGGLGAGGAIFARAGSTLTIQDSSFSGDIVVPGPAGAGPAVGGSAIGQAMFLGANANYSISSGVTTLSETIGGGNAPSAEGTFTKSGNGTLALVSAESYVGATTVNAGTLEILSNNVLLSPTITINSNAVFEYNSSIRVLLPTTTFTGAGTLRVIGTGNPTFGAGPVNVNFAPGALIDILSGQLTGSASYNGLWTSNQASMNIAGGAAFDAVESGPTGTMQIDALTGAGIFQGGYFGNPNGGLSIVSIGVAGGSGTFSGTLQDDSDARLGIVKAGNGTEIFSGTNTYSGNTTVTGGTLVINGTAGSGGVIVSAGVLAGTGAIFGPANFSTAGTLAPGAPTGTLTISNSLSLAGNTLITLNSGAHSEVTGLTSVTYGGTLTITNIGGPLSPGNVFTLFSAQSWSGNFSSIIGNPGPGLAFTFNPVNGVLSVISTLPTTPTNLTYSANSGTVTLKWPSNYTGWILQAQSNPLFMGITTGNWADVTGSASTDSMTFAISPTNNVFFRMRLP